MNEKQKIIDRFIEKFDLLQLSREEHQSEVFDELAHSIEVLLLLKPKAHDEFIRIKTEMDKKLEIELKNIDYRASQKDDVISEETYKNTNKDDLMWDYRELLEVEIMTILYKYGLVSINNKSQGVEKSEQVYRAVKF